VASPITRNIACRTIRNYMAWELVLNDGIILLHASEIEENYRLSFWDELIVAAAYSKNAAVILTEDLNHGQNIEGIRIRNPFLTDSPMLAAKKLLNFSLPLCVLALFASFR
jgi:predicted nucleic acid-binding protein